MAALTPLDEFTVPLGGQQVTLAQIDYVEGGMSLLRVRIREGKRFTVFDIDPESARRLGAVLLDWAGRPGHAEAGAS
ncbi:MAG: hypothetical protein M5U08_05475 [Burkholderiales bacterium]|nr:hypothetical protein [Burkholderiales bacterium]